MISFCCVLCTVRYSERLKISDIIQSLAQNYTGGTITGPLCGRDEVFGYEEGTAVLWTSESGEISWVIATLGSLLHIGDFSFYLWENRTKNI